MEDFTDKGSGAGQGYIAVHIQSLIDGKVQDLKDIIEARFRAVEDKIAFQGEATHQALTKAFDSAQLAVSKVEINTASRFESVNEFRNAMKDQAAYYATRNELKAIENITIGHVSRAEMVSADNALEQKLVIVSSDLDKRISAIETRNMGILVAIIITLLTALLALLKVFIGV